ncbi:MAG: hypothetical protein IJ859_00135 [Synergistaceae bacterium]|nr:hypothetical protein [Synergistaceae bacterium]
MFEKIAKFKEWIIEKAIEQVLWAEKNLRGKTGAEKKAAVVKKLDDMVELPFYLEWADDMVFSWLVDTVCEKLNALTGHKFANLVLSDAQEIEIAGSIEIPEGFIKEKNHD